MRTSTLLWTAGLILLARGGPSWGRLERVPVGTLAIGIIDAKTCSLVWRAAASKDLDLSRAS